MATKIAVKLTNAAYTDIKTPYLKMAGGWTVAKRVMVKDNTGQWQEVWPGALIYTHYGRAYNMNVAACFNNPVDAANYIFINEGEIGGSVADPALRIGSFPAGSTVTVINNGRIQGIGGNGGWCNRTSSGGGGFSGGGGSCFTGDSLVTMFDGTSKRIDEIQIGDVVQTTYGGSVVAHIQKPLLGTRDLLSMVDGRCKTSAEHPVWTKNIETGEEWWSTRDMVQWSIENQEAVKLGFEGFDKDATLITAENKDKYLYATTDGWIKAEWTKVDAPEDTPLYHLHLEDYNGYFVDGYLVEDGGVDHSPSGIYVDGYLLSDLMKDKDYIYSDPKWLTYKWDPLSIYEKET